MIITPKYKYVIISDSSDIDLITAIRGIDINISNNILMLLIYNVNKKYINFIVITLGKVYVKV